MIQELLTRLRDIATELNNPEVTQMTAGIFEMAAEDDAELQAVMVKMLNPVVLALEIMIVASKQLKVPVNGQVQGATTTITVEDNTEQRLYDGVVLKLIDSLGSVATSAHVSAQAASYIEARRKFFAQKTEG